MSGFIRPLTIKPWQLVLALAIMALSYVGGEWLKPYRYWADELGSPSYDHILPASFGPWSLVPNSSSAVVNPQQSQELEKIYSETVSRVYVNKSTGRAIMLSVAYGRDQSTDTQLHTPDMCYPSQGFRVIDKTPNLLQTRWGKLPVVRMNASMGQRIEPLTYFIRTGDRVTTQGSLDRNMARLAMALRGYRIDGLLVRVSELSRANDTFAVQDQFLVDLMSALSPEDRRKVIGDVADRLTVGSAPAPRQPRL